ncbi:peptidase associated/transthyretin-like domain-containing protein [Marinoscillum furvescens]|uniref:Carboxypeptidase-like protein n=1 Tax=Marinoscillum furvescens DSM 4134 TaxID=1122208 RepID=A0A3D9LGR5_MARFU|nr:hypothetical protein [Marinoscillum furvescens]REE05571.1 hypothetical protein C7460_10187 [Marinoscillum furvescens DSM 4134]
MNKRFLIGVIAMLVVTLAWTQPTIRLAGVVVDQETLDPIFGTTIFNKSRVGGAVTDSAGFFLTEVMPGDTLEFRDVRYVTSTLVVPEILQATDYGIIQMMAPNTVMLEEVSIFSFPTEREFREAFLASRPPKNLQQRAEEAKQDLMKTIKESYEDDKYFYEMWSDRRLYELTGQIQPNHWLDPFRWSEFVERQFAKPEKDD